MAWNASTFEEKLLVNVSYCSNNNLSEFFKEELTSKISGAFSITDNVILFAVYKIIFFQSKRKRVIDRICFQQWARDSIKNTPTWTNGNQETLIDHCLTTNYQTFDATVIEQLFGIDHFTQVLFSSLDIDYENNKTQFFTGILANLPELMLTKQLHQRIGVPCINKTMQNQLLKNFQICLKIFCIK